LAGFLQVSGGEPIYTKEPGQVGPYQQEERSYDRDYQDRSIGNEINSTKWEKDVKGWATMKRISPYFESNYTIPTKIQ
jgi:hypothetical protein